MSEKTSESKLLIESPNGESGFSASWQMRDKLGQPVTLTMRAANAADWRTVLGERAVLMDSAIKSGWATMTPAATPQEGTSNAAMLQAVAGAPAQPPATTPPQGTQPQATAGGIVDFQAEEIAVSADDDGNLVYKVKGGKYKKFGVRVWPEVLPALVADPAALKLGKNLYSAMVRAVLGDGGQPQKIIGLATH